MYHRHHLFDVRYYALYPRYYILGVFIFVIYYATDAGAQIYICIYIMYTHLQMFLVTFTSWRQFAAVSQQVAQKMADTVEQEAATFLEPLEHNYRIVASIKAALAQRTAKRSAYIAWMVDVDAKTNAYKKIQGMPGKESQAQAKEQAVSQAQDSADAAKAEFEKVSERLLTEFEVFKNQKAVDFKEAITCFVNAQVRFYCIVMSACILVLVSLCSHCSLLLFSSNTALSCCLSCSLALLFAAGLGAQVAADMDLLHPRARGRDG
jgi:hypothetical protein